MARRQGPNTIREKLFGSLEAGEPSAGSHICIRDQEEGGGGRERKRRGSRLENIQSSIRARRRAAGGLGVCLKGDYASATHPVPYWVLTF